MEPASHLRRRALQKQINYDQTPLLLQDESLVLSAIGKGRVLPGASFIRGRIFLTDRRLLWLPDDVGFVQELLGWAQKPLEISLRDIVAVERRVTSSSRLIVKADRIFVFSGIKSYSGQDVLDTWHESLRRYSVSKDTEPIKLAPLLDASLGISVIVIVGLVGVSTAILAATQGAWIPAATLSVSSVLVIYFIARSMRST